MMMLRYLVRSHRIVSNSIPIPIPIPIPIRPLSSPSCLSSFSSHSHSHSSVEFEADDHGVVRFSFAPSTSPIRQATLPPVPAPTQMRMQPNTPPPPPEKKKKLSRKKKVNQLRFYRLKARKRMKSLIPRVRIQYKLDKAKRKEAWLIHKLTKFHLPKPPPQTYDPEILTQEDKFYLKRIAQKKKHYVPLGRRGVFGGVVLNMHLHWKNHETIKVVCKPCRPGEIHDIAQELSRLSKGIVIEIMPGNIIIFYRGKNYVQPQVMSPPDTLSKPKALEKYKYQQSLEHTSEFIEKLEKELEAYHEHLARYKSGKDNS